MPSNKLIRMIYLEVGREPRVIDLGFDWGKQEQLKEWTDLLGINFGWYRLYSKISGDRAMHDYEGECKTGYSLLFERSYRLFQIKSPNVNAIIAKGDGVLQSMKCQDITEIFEFIEACKRLP